MLFRSISAKDDSNLTALHLAVHEGHTKMVERLVGYGADLNCTTEEGNTPLHLALGRNTMLPPSHLTPEIMKVRSSLFCLYMANLIRDPHCV